jgi:hypothetical protein
MLRSGLLSSSHEISLSPESDADGICQCRRFNTDIRMTLGAPCDLSTTGVPEHLSLAVLAASGTFGPLPLRLRAWFFPPRRVTLRARGR